MTPKHAAPEGAEREAFEAWAKERPWVEFSDYAWQAWQARAALTQGKQQAEGAVDRSQPVGAGMTDEAIMDAMRPFAKDGGRWPSDWVDAARAVLALSAAASAPAGERTAKQMSAEYLQGFADGSGKPIDAFVPQMREHEVRVRAEALEEAARAVLHEVLHLEEVNCEEDVAYNTAISHAHKAIRALIEGDGSLRDKGESRG